MIVKRGKRYAALPYDQREGKKVYVGTFDTRREAKAVHDDYLTQARKERSRRPQLPTCAELIDRYLNEEASTKAFTTEYAYRQAAKVFTSLFGEVPVDELDTDDVEKWAASQSNQNTVKRVRTILNWTPIARLIPNPVPAPKLKRRTHEVTIPTEKQIRKLAEAAMVLGPERGPVFRGMILLMAGTGMRPGELFALEHKSVDLSRGEIQVRSNYDQRGNKNDTKNHKPRKIALLQIGREGYEQTPRRLDTDYVFFDPKGKPWKHARWGQICQKVAKEAGMEGFRFYDLRHFVATKLLEAGLPSYVVAIQLGHSDNGRLVENTYGHPSVDTALARIKASEAPNVRSIVRDAREELA